MFAGDRSEEFAARMAGVPYSAGGIKVTTEATRSASDDQLRNVARGLLKEMHESGTTTVEIKSGSEMNDRTGELTSKVSPRKVTESIRSEIRKSL